MPDLYDDNIIRLKTEELTADDTFIGTAIEEDDGSIVKIEENHSHNALVHLSPLLAGSVTGMPFIGPLLGWMILKNAHPNSMAHVKESLNFTITMFLLGLIAIPILIMGWFAIVIPVSTEGMPTVGTSIFAVLLVVSVIWLLILGLFSLIAPLVAAYKASRGGFFRYPFTIRFIK